MSEVAPLATPQSLSVHISELIREAKSVDVILSRLQATNNNNNNTSSSTAPLVTSSNNDEVTTEQKKEEGRVQHLDDDVAEDDASPSVNPLDATDSDGRTAFHWCLALKRFDLALALAERGCSLATVDFDSTSTLTTACAVDAPPEILKLIAEKAQDFYYFPKSPSSSSPSSSMPFSRCFSSVAPAPPANPMINVVGTHFWNIADTAGNTPLLYLASRGNVKGLKVVLGMVPSDATLRFRPTERAEEAKRRHQLFYASTKSGVAPSSGENMAMDGDDASSAAPTSAPSESISTSDVGQGQGHGEGSHLAPLPCYCDVFAQNNRLQTALHRAVSKGSQDFVEELLAFVKKHGADAATVRNFINAPDNQGNTVLHYASMENNEDLGKYLLRNGASRDAKNKKGQEFWQL